MRYKAVNSKHPTVCDQRIMDALYPPRDSDIIVGKLLRDKTIN